MLVDERSIIFITIYPFNEDYGIKYGFDVLREKGFQLFIVNVSDFLYPNLSQNKKGYYCDLKRVMGVEQVGIKSGRELKDFLTQLRGWKIAVPVVYPFVKLIRILKSTKIDYMMHNASCHPEPQEKDPRNIAKRTFTSRLLRLTKRFIKNPNRIFFLHVLNFLYFFTYRLSFKYPFLFGMKCPKYYIMGTQINFHPFLPLSKMRIINAHSFDYDRFLRNKDKPRPNFIPDEDYFLHIADTPWGGHDYLFMNIKGGITKAEYSEIINNFFDFVEQQTGKKVVIAAHPKHTDEDNIYNGRPFLYDTEQLIKYSSGVICHFSGAIRFAVIHKKPVCFISIWKMKDDKHFQSFINAYAESLDSESYYIDIEKDLNRMKEKGFFPYNSKAYENYMRKYIKPFDTPERSLWEIVADSLCNER